MNKLFALSLGVLLVIVVDSLPLSGISKEFNIKLVRREAANNSSLPQGNSSALCINETNCNATADTSNLNLTNHSNVTGAPLNLTRICKDNTTGMTLQCNGTTLNLTKNCEDTKNGNVTVYCIKETSVLNNDTSNVNLTNSLNVKGTLPLNLTRICKDNTTGITLHCNGTTLNLTRHCDDAKNGNVTVYCIDETSVSNNVSLSSNATLLNVTLIMENRTISNTSMNSTAPNVNETLNGTVDLSATISPSQTVSVSMTSTLSASPSLSLSVSSSHYPSLPTQVSTSSSIQPSSTSSVAVASSSSVAAVTVAATDGSTTRATTAESTTSQTTTVESTTSQTTTVASTTPQTTTAGPTTPQTTDGKTETDRVTFDSTSAKAETEHTDQSTTVTMESPYNSAKNVKFFYVNVLIPVGAGVCGALLIAFCVILFKCCRRRKLKKVRYFGKPRKGYSQTKMDHMNLLSSSSDEE